MDKRTTIAKARPAKTVVMKTPPRMTGVMDRVSAQAREVLISPELGITRMPTGPGEEVGSPDQTSLFVRRFPTKEVEMEGRVNPSATTIQSRKANSNMVTRMVYADEHSPPIQPANFRAEIPLSRNPRLPLPPPGRVRSKNKGRAATESVRRIERLLKPAILIAVVAVCAVVVLAQRSENVADAAGAANNSSREKSDPSDQGVAPHTEPDRTPKNAPVAETPTVAASKGADTATSEKLPSKGSEANATGESSAPVAVGTSQTNSESKAASLLISGHREEALNHYRKLAALPNAGVGVRAMFIVLEQKVKSP